MDILNIFLLFLNFYTYLYVGCKLNNLKFKITLQNFTLILIISVVHRFLPKFSFYHYSKIMLTFIMLFFLFKQTFKQDFFKIIELCFFTLIIMIIAEQFISIIFTKILNIDLCVIKSNKLFLLISNIAILILYVLMTNIKYLLVKFYQNTCNLDSRNNIIRN
ncbi:accessory gene regulator AgrC, partial [Clostridium novyi A str. 4552]